MDKKLINLKKESLIFLVIFIVASFVIHNSAWLSHPLEHLSSLSSHSMPYHPVLYTFLIFLIFLVFRGIFLLVKKIVGKK